MINAATNRFFELDIHYVSSLFRMILQQATQEPLINTALKSAVIYVFENGLRAFCHDAFHVIKWGYSQNLLTYNDVLIFIELHLDDIFGEDDFTVIASIISILPTEMQHRETISERFKEQIVKILSDDLKSFIEISDAICNVDWEDYDEAKRQIVKSINLRLLECGVELNTSQTELILESFDVHDALDSYIIDSSDDYRSDEPELISLQIDEIDDLYYRDEH